MNSRIRLLSMSVWKPSDTYTYAPTAAADVKSALATTAGAGNLTVSKRE